MNIYSEPTRRIAIACGGTGGHLFPGLAIAQKLVDQDCEVTLLVSTKEVDQQAVKDLKNVRVRTLPAVCLERGRKTAFTRAFVQSLFAARRLFKSWKPDAVLAMGGFTSAPPIIAAKLAKVRTFLHESNTIPGRANRWLSGIVDQAFVGFSSAARKLSRCPVTLSGTPVRLQVSPQEPEACRSALGLDPCRPVMLVMGGSQGARGINEIISKDLPRFAEAAPDLQWFHLTGAGDTNEYQKVYDQHHLTALVYPFFDRMDLALGAATAAISRAGASTLAELAAVRLPSILIPYPTAQDNHQWHNASAYAATGAAKMLEQQAANVETLSEMVLELIQDEFARKNMQAALTLWDRPDAADRIARAIIETIAGVEEPLPASLSGLSEVGLDALGQPVHPRLVQPMVHSSSGKEAVGI